MSDRIFSICLVLFGIVLTIPLRGYELLPFLMIILGMVMFEGKDEEEEWKL